MRKWEILASTKWKKKKRKKKGWTGTPILISAGKQRVAKSGIIVYFQISYWRKKFTYSYYNVPIFIVFFTYSCRVDSLYYTSSLEFIWLTRVSKLALLGFLECHGLLQCLGNLIPWVTLLSCVTIWSIYPFWASYRCWHVARALRKLGSCRFHTVKFRNIKVIIIIFFIDITISFFYFYICNWFVLLLNYKENKSILKLFLFIYMYFSKKSQ